MICLASMAEAEAAKGGFGGGWSGNLGVSGGLLFCPPFSFFFLLSLVKNEVASLDFRSEFLSKRKSGILEMCPINLVKYCVHVSFLFFFFFFLFLWVGTCIPLRIYVQQQ